MRSLTVGDAADPATIMGPLIETPSPKLERGLTSLDAGESWLVQPRCIDAEANMWSPGVRVDVLPGSWFHLTECFGPVLGLMRAPDLDTAIAWQNQVEYGLTGGIHSLDPLEIETWLSRVEIGNAYINRYITGAIVQRQPFGGWKKSSIGAGSKPGGPGHLDSYGTWTAPLVEPEAVRSDFQQTWTAYFGAAHDPSGMACEANTLRFRPVDRVVVRVDDSDSAHVRLLQMGAQITGVDIEISEMARQDDAEFATYLGTLAGQGTVRLRLLTEASDSVHAAAFAAGIAVDRSPVTGIPMIELRRWVMEQAVSQTLHRHGRLLRR